MLSKEALDTSTDSTLPTYVDLMDEDKPIPGQKFVCVSFVSPDKILKNKELFYMEEFVKKWDMAKSMEKFQGFLNFMCYKYNLETDTIMTDYKDFVSEERDDLNKFTIEDDYKNFLDLQEDDLEKRFNSQHKFQTSTRGMKVRGVYSTQEEAEMRCKMLRELDPNHDVYVGPIGLWMPWDPNAYKTGRIEYLEDDLNKLMHEKASNEKSAKIEFDKRVQEAKEKAIEENMKIAEKSGNTLTQIMNDDGNLVNVREVDFDAIPDETVLTTGAYSEENIENAMKYHAEGSSQFGASNKVEDVTEQTTEDDVQND